MGNWFLWAVSVQYFGAACAYAYNKNWPLAGCLMAYSFANVCLTLMAK